MSSFLIWAWACSFEEVLALVADVAHRPCLGEGVEGEAVVDPLLDLEGVAVGVVVEEACCEEGVPAVVVVEAGVVELTLMNNFVLPRTTLKDNLLRERRKCCLRRNR